MELTNIQAKEPSDHGSTGVSRKDELREQIRELVTQYHTAAFPPRTFTPGQSDIPVSGKVFDAEDIQYAVDASLDFWLTTGRFATQFERLFARVMNVRAARLVNPGSVPPDPSGSPCRSREKVQ